MQNVARRNLCEKCNCHNSYVDQVNDDLAFIDSYSNGLSIAEKISD